MTALRTGDTIGILGGGQLGRMLAMGAAQLGLQTLIFAPEEESPAAQVAAGCIRADYTDLDALSEFAACCQAVTFEFENVPKTSLEVLVGKVPLRPGIMALEKTQDRLIEKRFLEGLGLSVAPYRPVDTLNDLTDAFDALGRDAILKTRRFGYDGKGQVNLKRGSGDCAQAWSAVAPAPSVLEARVPFLCEVSAIVARGKDGEAVVYDVPQNTHSGGILQTSSVGSFATTQLSPSVYDEARTAAVAVAEGLDHVGVLAVEFFVLDSDSGQTLIVNEVAPRVHNTGHWTLDACAISQFENHIRAVAGWPLGATQRHSDAMMTNLIGEDIAQAQAALAEPQNAVHVYGKTEVRPGRKLGHLTRLSSLTQSAL
ncbi:MAG: 5-(carboxyamino)imidazole ribonucleotide synthase [Pseudomonadota bacterium]